MKSTGIVRKVDELGRIVLPIELRRTMGIEVKGRSWKSNVDGDQYRPQEVRAVLRILR